MDLNDIAERINRLHVGSPGTKELAPNYRLVGLEGERAAAAILGVPYSPEINGGDGGIDLKIKAQGTWYKVDVKTSRRPHLGMLVGLPLRADIYISASYPRLDILGWQWRIVVSGFPIVDRGHGIKSHNVQIAALRKIEDLIAAIDR